MGGGFIVNSEQYMCGGKITWKRRKKRNYPVIFCKVQHVKQRNYRAKKEDEEKTL